MAVKVSVNGTTAGVSLGRGDGQLAQMRAAIGGGYVTPLAVTLEGPDGPQQATMWCDDDGMMKGLPVNPLASQIAGQRILGDVLLSSPGEVN